MVKETSAKGGMEELNEQQFSFHSDRNFLLKDAKNRYPEDKEVDYTFTYQDRPFLY